MASAGALFAFDILLVLTSISSPGPNENAGSSVPKVLRIGYWAGPGEQTISKVVCPEYTFVEQNTTYKQLTVKPL